MNRISMLSAWAATAVAFSMPALATPAPQVRVQATARPVTPKTQQPPNTKNVIFFVGDGMGVSTITAARIFSVGVDGELTIDQFPFTALSKTYTSDFITPDSAGTMTAMITGQNTNSGVIGMDESTERGDFNGDGDGARLTTLLEMAKASGRKVGVVSTARVTHATPAACYAKVHDRNFENEIALQALPTDPTYNTNLGTGIDLMMGGGRRFFTPGGMIDEEGETGSRTDGRDLRQEFQAAGYEYVWNRNDFVSLTSADLPVLGLFERSHMEYEYDRILDAGGEPSITEMTAKAIELLDNPAGFFLMVESGRIDHAHHAGNAWRALVETEEFDQAIAAALAQVDLAETLIVVTADHSHVFNIQGYPMRPQHELPYQVPNFPVEWITGGMHNGLFNLAYGLDSASGTVVSNVDANGTPYTPLVYANGPGYRGMNRMDPFLDTHMGVDGNPVSGPLDPNYLQEAAIPLSSETHSGEDVGLYAIGRGARFLRGTVKNTRPFFLMKNAMGL